MAADTSSFKGARPALDTLDSAVAGVHSAVDRAMDAAAPPAQRYDAAVDSVSENPEGQNRIDIQAPHAIGDLAEELGVTRDELTAAVEKVGPMLDDVLRELRKNQPPHPSLF